MAIGVQVWSQTAANNATIDTNINFAEGQAPSSLNDSCRAAMSSVAKWRDDNNGTLVTAGTTTALTVTTNQVEGALTAGYTVKLFFASTPDSSATLAVDGLAAKPLQMQAGTNIAFGQIAANNIVSFTYSTTGTGQWIANGPAAVTSTATSTNIVGTALTNALSGNVTLNNIANYIDGPSVAQGNAGTWFACGTVTVQPAAGAYQIGAKLWDGTTLISATETFIPSGAGGNNYSMSLCGVLSNPAGNLRISVRDPSQTTSLILKSQSAATGANSNASYITALRIS